MQAAHENDQAAAGGGYAGGPSGVGIPEPEGPGNAAWQKTLQMLERVHLEEQARRRAN